MPDERNRALESHASQWFEFTLILVLSKTGNDLTTNSLGYRSDVSVPSPSAFRWAIKLPALQPCVNDTSDSTWCRPLLLTRSGDGTRRWLCGARLQRKRDLLGSDVTVRCAHRARFFDERCDDGSCSLSAFEST